VTDRNAIAASNRRLAKILNWPKPQKLVAYSRGGDYRGDTPPNILVDLDPLTRGSALDPAGGSAPRPPSPHHSEEIAATGV